MSNSELKEILDVLMKEGLVINSGKSLDFTEKAYQMIYDGTMVRIIDHLQAITKINIPINWELRFMSFITECKVPARLEGSKGDAYAANKYSEKAMKIFKAAIEGGVDYELLKKSVTLYYRSTLAYKKTIGNYFTQGDWKSGYIDLRDIIATGTSQQLIDHIKTETDDSDKSQYSLG